MKKETLLKQVKQNVQQIDPQAEVILFGSRARGDARPDSDWDFLILTDKKMTSELQQEIWDTLYEKVELPNLQVISALIHEKGTWQQTHQVTPLYQNIKQEGQLL